ncbi:hypothetical protein TcasGA2_TC000489 [Tribolium castaneum]|uniref:Uncharacterized protein n=1 Tax=Tribolium castaneum TaxID=7070 RepID=D6WA06_TRICA|nr:hypothetical protein TcasGA2_TC000489 [Tribolium castaneum]
MGFRGAPYSPHHQVKREACSRQKPDFPLATRLLTITLRFDGFYQEFFLVILAAPYFTATISARFEPTLFQWQLLNHRRRPHRITWTVAKINSRCIAKLQARFSLLLPLEYRFRRDHRNVVRHVIFYRKNARKRMLVYPGN